MGRLRMLLRAIRVSLTNPRAFARLANDESVWQAQVVRKYGKNMGLASIDLLDLLPGFEETVTPFAFLDGGSLPTDLAMLKGLARRYSGCKYFEIGTWRGESASNVASVAQEVTTMSLPPDDMRKMGLSEDFVKIHGVFSKNLPNVRHLQHDSLTFDFKPLTGKFDVVFVDGGHNYQCVRSDTENAYPLLRNDDSVIVWHDYGWNPESVRWEVLGAILDGTPPELHGRLYHVSNTICAIMTRRELKSSYHIFPRWPNKRFQLDIKAVPFDSHP